MMTYLLLFCLLWIVTFGQLARLVDSSTSYVPTKKSALVIGVGLLLVILFFGIAWLIDLNDVQKFERDKTMVMKGEYVFLWLLGVGSLIAIVCFGFLLNCQRKFSRSLGFGAIGECVVGLVIGLYMAFALIDQLSFWASSRGDVGFVNLSFFEGAVKDIHCDGEILLVKDFASNQAIYRCSLPGAMVFGRYSVVPFVLWPGYREGISRDLPVALKNMGLDRRMQE